ncbi:hypothetical protein EGI26_11730 [Lacihabitans sp. CCS-44]|uniref:DUF6932 family protein n=1 Tax=Lacihabitans sp. CCS-44 TaxID=2487331 RepID=UPI0020CD7CAC|nr:hypothetical protein [Lacihabitans sp. CCS-44]MCP9755826.1 hypothetical protein [Lacihabitans sp. CCS-44]
MAKKEYPPLIKKGFVEIGLWQFDALFLQPFKFNDHRKKLIDSFIVFLEEFKKLGLRAEIWIDGSFTTEKEEPDDIDLLFLLDINEVDNLTGNKAKLFKDLLISREKVKVRFGLDVYFINMYDSKEKAKWIETYGFDSGKLNEKGIFKLDVQ